MFPNNDPASQSKTTSQNLTVERLAPSVQHRVGILGALREWVSIFTPSKDPKLMLEHEDNAFCGPRRWNSEMRFWPPSNQGDLDPETGIHSGEEYQYKNLYGEVKVTIVRGVETYLSPSRCQPRELIVQASDFCQLQPNYLWNRRRIKGSVPTALRISEWALRPAFHRSRNDQHTVHWVGVPLFLLRTILVTLPLQAYMTLPLFTHPWEEDEAGDTYIDWPDRLWTWPKFAVNPLDMEPESSDLEKPKLSAVPRLLRPRLLMVLEGDEWVQKDLDKDINSWKPYVMVSYTNHHSRKAYNSGFDNSEACHRNLKRVAAEQTEQAGLKAYWLDFECRAPSHEKELLDSDVNRFCDVVRGASRVVVVLPDSDPISALEWGKRMWTLPEGLLAPGHKVFVHYMDLNSTIELSKVEMASLMWREIGHSRGGEDAQTTRLLAEHYSGTIQLSRLDLMSTAISALWDRQDSPEKLHTPAELAHALMGLLHMRIDPVSHNTLFQDIAKLSLLNDNDQLIERMVCLLPEDDRPLGDPEQTPDSVDPFRMLARPDQFGTHLWDIHPSCHVVGVGNEDHTVILNECHAIPIRWKNFPRMLYKRAPSLKKLAAEILLRSGAWWVLAGFGLAVYYTPFWIGEGEPPAGDQPTPYDKNVDKWLEFTVAVFFSVGALLALLGPLSLRVLYGGMVMKPARHLVGFEGTLPLAKVEEVTFGNCDKRLSYQPSSTPFCRDHRHKKERYLEEPLWILDPTAPGPVLKPGHRLFTLVDTGNLAVSVFQAKYPPTVALICGKEGGMLRTVLCRWDLTKGGLQKETVIRMPTETYAMATVKGWLKLDLGP